jgi:phenylpropionate dioxygenase-like ring-hydroxylating dioxygenase large terminal subunit
MIRDQWYIVMDSGQVKHEPVGVTRMGEKLVFWRNTEGNVSCLRDQCAHRGVALSKGKIVHDHLQCPFHGFEYDTSGRCVLIPANGRETPIPPNVKVHQYPIYEAHDFIWIWWGDNPPNDLRPPRFFDDLDDAFSYGQIYDPWNAHYSRVIENQLDVLHLPFVHHNTIGRGERTLVDGPLVEWVDDECFYVYVFNRIDDGSSPRKPETLVKPDNDFRLEFIFPNLWQNHISEEVRIIVAFVPVDDAHTILYLRFYQKFMQIPLLRDMVNWLAMPFNRFVAHQDRRVVVTQIPKPSGLRIGERLVQGDRPIVEYRRHRQALLDAVKER